MKPAPWFFADFQAPEDDTALVLLEDAVLQHHLKTVIRAKAGFTLVLVSIHSEEAFLCELQASQGKTLRLKIRHKIPSRATLPQKPKRIVIASLAKADAWEGSLQKLTELQVDVIVPYHSDRSVIKVDVLKDADKKMQRWRDIIKHAAQQSERFTLPLLYPVTTRSQLTEIFSSYPMAYKLLANEREGQPLGEALQAITNQPELLWAVGPEGGWTPEELALFTEAGFIHGHLAGFILRVETAHCYLAAAIDLHQQTRRLC
jgi:16S rRNA (uracil1498-N3)-methyltransferase